MSEDEGSVDSTANAEETDDAAPTDGAESGGEQGEPAGESVGEGSNVAGKDATATDASEAADAGFARADPEPAESDADAADDVHVAGADDVAAAAGGSASTPVSEDIVDRVAEYDDDAAGEVRALVERAFELKGQAERVPALQETVDSLQDEVQSLEDEVESLEEEVASVREEREDLKSKLARKQADFKNYKERQKRKQEQMKERATEDLVERLVDVRDNLKRALDQDVDDDESIRGGVEMTLKEFDRVLAEENVEEIAPEVGEDVDPQRHEVMVRVDSDQPEGTIAELFNPGYEMADRVIQAAQVTVSTGAEHSSDDGEDAADAQPEADGGEDGAASEADESGGGEGDGAVALGGEVDDGTAAAGEDVDEASDDDISAALDDE
jgi:molecular chaperone GrpE